MFLVIEKAWCYHNASLFIIKLSISKSTRLLLITSIHLGTEDGKSLADAHFVIAMRYVSSI